jgi:hypothetical protein
MDPDQENCEIFKTWYKKARNATIFEQNKVFLQPEIVKVEILIM